MLCALKMYLGHEPNTLSYMYIITLSPTKNKTVILNRPLKIRLVTLSIRTFS